MSTPPAIIGFAAFSGTGKTSLLTQLIPLLKKQGLRIGVIKGSHHNFEIDQPGKDSYQLRMAGASPLMLVSPYRRVIITELAPAPEVHLNEQLAAFPMADLDIILVEGFKEADIPKIELHRPSLGKPLLYPQDPYIIAIASDELLDTPTGLIQLDLNDVESISKLIRQHFLGKYRTY
jgi:molybdopterin-guanine dinucleotide biosynthesis protein B